MNYVYILRCRDNSLYTGWTNNLEKRIETHKLGKGSKYTRSRLPLRLETFFILKSKNEALSLERKIKSLTKNQKEELILSKKDPYEFMKNL
ncbi:MAG: GIY-YIG nuclease family protein [Tissierellia bacterium]|nr:GIY-YIG nuclease family protein [Tissierellia bacterium]